jgi:hypothetical protein
MRLNEFKVIKGIESNHCIIDSIFHINNKEIDKDIINYYDENIKYLINLEKRYNKIEKYKNSQYKQVFGGAKNEILKYEKNEVVIYGIGKHTDDLLNYFGKMDQIKGLLDNNINNIGKEKYNYKVLNINEDLDNIKLIIISSLTYEEEIYERIKYFKNNGITIMRIYADDFSEK